MPKAAETAGTGTRHSHFAQGAKWGPFDCGHCRHYLSSNGKGVCVHPAVIADGAPVLRERDSTGRPYVDKADCCEYQRKAEGKTEPETSDTQRSGMRG